MQTLLNIHELSKQLNAKESFIRSLIFQKKIPYIKIGRLVRFSQTEINNWLKKGESYEQKKY